MLGHVALPGIGDVFLVEGIMTCRVPELRAQRLGRLRGIQLVLVSGDVRLRLWQREAALMSGELLPELLQW